MNELFDVCVIGAGPAGSALALRLVQLGRSVAVVEKAPFPRSHIGESLSSSVVPLLGVLGILPQVEAAGFNRAPRATVLWAGQLRHRDYHGGYQIDRGVFDAVLRRSAVAAGASMLLPARVVDIDQGENWSIQLQNGKLLRARFLADAAGRGGILGGRKKISGSRTIAMCANWSKVDADRTATLVEAGLSQWYWGVPLPDGSFNAAVFVAKQNARKELYLPLIRQSRLLASPIAKADCGELRICDATPFLDEMPVTRCSIKAGDSAITIDPLSSQGVQTALGTALHAAVVINTILDRPEQADLAMDFYHRRIVESDRFHRRATGELYREQSEFVPSKFWNERAATCSSVAQHRRPSLVTLDQQVQISPHARFAPIATVTDKYVVHSSGIELDGAVYGRVGDFSLADLLRTITHPILARDLVGHWAGEMPISSALGVLGWAWEHGLVEAVK